jgi:hypothetical protein
MSDSVYTQKKALKQLTAAPIAPKNIYNIIILQGMTRGLAGPV